MSNNFIVSTLKNIIKLLYIHQQQVYSDLMQYAF